MTLSNNYQECYSYSKSISFDQKRIKKLFNIRWFFNCARSDFSTENSILIDQLFDESYFIIHKL